VAIGFTPLDYPATPEGARRAGVELSNPFTAEDAEALARGAEVFATFCAVCHGVGGAGDGPVTRRGVPPPPSLLAENAMALPDGHIYHIISLGQGNMAGYASQVSRDDRWRAIKHVRRLQAEAQAAGEPLMEPVDTRTDPAAAGSPAPPTEVP